MNDFIFNFQPQAQKLLFGSPWDAFIPPLVGSFFGIIGAFLVNYTWQYLKGKHHEFLGEYHIKAELSGFAHKLRVGGRPLPIEPIYGAEYVKDNSLFGENCTLIAFWYRGFEKYNTELERLEKLRKKACTHNEIRFAADMILTKQSSMANQIDAMLKLDLFKKIPDDMSNSGLSIPKFIWYVLKQDALEEPTREGDFIRAIVDMIRSANDKLAFLDYNLASGPRNGQT